MNDDQSGNAGNMNIRRFVADSSRAALRQVREALGGDAIILANRSIEGGVEVLAAAPEAVDALTRRMTSSTPRAASPQAPATPTELGLKPVVDEPTPAATQRKRLASLFSRRTQGESPSFAAQTSTPIATRTTTTIATTIATATATPGAVARAAGSYATFATELAAVTPDDDDFVTRLAPQAVALSRPLAVEPAAIEAPVAPSAPVEAQPEVAAPPSFSASDLSDVVAREVSREVGRELGRDVLNDLTRDVSREVSQAVTEDVVRGVTRDVSRDVTRDVTREVVREMHAMQASLSEQLATLTWTDAMRRQPVRTKLMQDLILAGFSPSLSRHIQERLPDDYGNDEAHAWARSILRRNLPVATDAEELINEGGVFALVGPTGVGKTTTVAKLAARFAMKHGIDQLALITTDGFRIGAQDQLRIYGKILGVAVHSIHDEASLTSAIAHLKDKKLVLIDTAGLGQRDERVAEQIAMLRGAKAKRLVVLNATADAETLDSVVATFADREFAGCVITKTDEAMRLGPVLDAVIRHKLRIHHVSTGQNVPEDLDRPDADVLVARALTRPVARPAFELRIEDESLWMSAMAGRAATLPTPLEMPAIGRARSGALHA